MAPKKKTSTGTMQQRDVTHVKYVAKAGMWVTTVVNSGKQTQKWSEQKPS